MNIGIDARFYGSLGKGLGRYTQKLIERLELLDHSNQYIIFLRQENFDEYQPKNKNFHKVLADYQWYSFSEQLVFPFLLMRYKCDVMHFPHFNVPIAYFGTFIVTIHDLILIHFPTQRATTLHPLWYKIKFVAYKIAIWWAIKKSDHIMTVSDFTKQDILKHYSVSSKKITVAYEAVDTFCWHHSSEKNISILQKYGLMVHEAQSSCGIIKPYLLYVGNAYPHKNLEALVEVLDTVALRDITLVLVGKEDYFYSRLKRTVLAKNMQNVIFIGFVSDDELDVLYRFGRAYIFPSLYEGFGLPPLEAMSRGLPVMASQATSLPEVLGDAAMYFNSKDKASLSTSIRTLWDDEVLRERLRQRGYAHVTRFNWDDMAKITLRCYKQ